MQRLPLLLLLPLASACGADTAPEQVRRGHDLFAPTARKIAEGLVEETRVRDPGAVAKLVESAALKDAAAFLDFSTREILVRYGVVLALTKAQAEEFGAGRFDDPGNRKRVNETLAAFAKGGLPLPEVCRFAIDRVRSGAWTGLDLEFAARMLWSEAMRPR